MCHILSGTAPDSDMMLLYMCIVIVNLYNLLEEENYASFIFLSQVIHTVLGLYYSMNIY